MNDHNNEQIKELLSAEPIPDAISPENMQAMLEQKAPTRKKNRIIRRTTRVAAGAAACAVLCVFGAQYARQNGGSLLGTQQSGSNTISPTEVHVNTDVLPVSDMRSAASYEELYNMLEKGSANSFTTGSALIGGMGLAGGQFYGTENGAIMDGAGMDDMGVGIPETDMSYAEESTGTDTSRTDYTQTYNQEQNVLEADIAKTDGEYIYYLYTDYSKTDTNGQIFLNIAAAKDGSFTESCRLNLTDDFVNAGSKGAADSVSFQDMYLYNDMLIIISSTSYHNAITYGEGSVGCGLFSMDTATCINVYTTGTQPEKIASYVQDGSYHDVRITEDGYLYLITNDTSQTYEAIESAEDLENYIPTYSFNSGCMVLPPEDILMPEDMPDSSYTLSYTVVGSLDLNTPGAVSECETKAITGYSGSIYCSGSNLYLAEGSQNTNLTRIALNSGSITPAATGSVTGYIKDQFSMSEYNGYLRVAASIEDWTLPVVEGAAIRSNCVYVLDMDLNIVGSVGGFGIGESIKSVSFSGDMGYVVTYEQTDPLFSIDLSDPTQPVILDEFKILGYSTYMQQWSDGLLLGFGANADENGVEDGVKLVMFNNADPSNLSEVGVHVMSGGSSGYLWSEALWERKALLIAPEKNLIGVPLTTEQYSEEYRYAGQRSAYRFFSYENGQFVQKGEIYKDTDFFDQFARALYIGDYVYILSGDSFVAADITTITETARADFS